jgi:SAM-dependent methyltransferase
MPTNGRSDAMCPGCHAKERNRSFALFLRERHEMKHAVLRVLHVAPEPALAGRLAAQHPEYVSIDIDPAAAMVQGDITALPFADESFDVVICSHVLEHVEEDAKAMRELRRVLATGGWAAIQCPVDYGRQKTFVDPALTTPEERLGAYGQVDHVRIYGADFPDRLRAAGFGVETVDMTARVGADQAGRYGLLRPRSTLRGDLIYVCRREEM